MFSKENELHACCWYLHHHVNNCSRRSPQSVQFPDKETASRLQCQEHVVEPFANPSCSGHLVDEDMSRSIPFS